MLSFLPNNPSYKQNNLFGAAFLHMDICFHTWIRINSCCIWYDNIFDLMPIICCGTALIATSNILNVPEFLTMICRKAEEDQWCFSLLFFIFPISLQADICVFPKKYPCMCNLGSKVAAKTVTEETAKFHMLQLLTIL